MRMSAPLSIVISATLLVLGLSPIDHATGDTASARGSTHSAIDKLSSIRNSVTQSSDDLSSLSALLEDERRQHVRMLPFVDIAIRESRATLATAQQDVNARRADLSGTRTLLTTARRDLVQRVQDIDATIEIERTAFTRSAGYLAVANQLQTRHQTLLQRETELEVRLSSDPTIVRATGEVNESERRLKQLRNEPDSQHLVAQASQSWIAAKNRFTAARRAIIEKDTIFVSAREGFRLAQQEMARVRKTFETEVYSLPSVTHAIALRDEADRAVRQCESAVATARQSADRAQTFLESSKADVEMLERMKKDGDAQLKTIQSEIADVQSALDGTADAASVAASDLGGTISALDSADAAIAAAGRKIAELERELAAIRSELDEAKRDEAEKK